MPPITPTEVSLSSRLAAIILPAGLSPASARVSTAHVAAAADGGVSGGIPALSRTSVKGKYCATVETDKSDSEDSDSSISSLRTVSNSESSDDENIYGKEDSDSDD